MLHSELIPALEAGSKRLMVVLHGLGDSMEGYRWLPMAMNLPGMNYLLVDAPDEYYTGFSWFDIYGDRNPGIERSRKLLFVLLDEYREKGFPTEQTIQFGFSQGCLMSMEIAVRYPHKLAGVVGISGFIQDAEGLAKAASPVAKEQRILVTHGDADPLLPINEVRGQIQFLQGQGIPILWREFRKEHTIAGDEELGVIRDFVNGSFDVSAGQ